jgi:hypothetical protein
MPSTFSTTLRLELPSNGEQSGIWGQTLNKDISLIEQAIAGITDIYLTGGNYTLSSFNGLEDEARSAVISCTGILSAAANVVAPSVQKTYIITNTAGANVTIKTSTGNGVTVLNGTSSLVYCDGTDFYTAVSLNNVIGNQTISGNEAIGANVTAGGNLTVTSNVTSFNGNLTFTSNTSIVTAGVNTGAYTPPTGTTAQRPTSPIGGMSRFNTEAGTYEIFNGAVWQAITGAYAVNYLIVAGGGGGGNCNSFGFRGGGGGAAGGCLANVSSVQPGTAYTITVGAGGAAATSGSNSSAFSLTAIKGGYGGGQASSGIGASGGSGGGGEAGAVGGSGTSGQGFAGGSGVGSGGSGGGGGGGGAVGVASTSSQAGNGGIGLNSSITGSSAYYAGGGGGGTYNGTGGANRGNPGTGGSGGGGNGGSPGVENTAGDGAVAATAGTPNTGGGGGGDTALVYNGGATQTSLGAAAGGSGIVIVSYPSATQRATGGTVTTYTSSGTVYWVHTFTTSGTFTA